MDWKGKGLLKDLKTRWAGQEKENGKRIFCFQTGYGDAVPMLPAARGVVTLQAVTG